VADQAFLGSFGQILYQVGALLGESSILPDKILVVVFHYSLVFGSQSFLLLGRILNNGYLLFSFGKVRAVVYVAKVISGRSKAFSELNVSFFLVQFTTPQSLIVGGTSC